MSFCLFSGLVNVHAISFYMYLVLIVRMYSTLAQSTKREMKKLIKKKFSYVFFLMLAHDLDNLPSDIECLQEYVTIPTTESNNSTECPVMNEVRLHFMIF